MHAKHGMPFNALFLNELFFRWKCAVKKIDSDNAFKVYATAMMCRRCEM